MVYEEVFRNLLMPLKHYTIPVFIPELACPFRCIYCDQYNISGKVKMTSPDNIKNIVNEHLASFREVERVVEIGFFGGNFTGIDTDLQKTFLDEAQKFVDAGSVNAIRLSTRPDYIDDQRLSLLQKYSVKTIELGAQSMDDEVLLSSGRGHTSDDVAKASLLIKSKGFTLGLQMMIGLPGDTLEKSIITAKKIIGSGATETRIYPLLVIKGTEIEKFYKSGIYKPLSLDEAVRWTKEIYKLFDDEGVKILRIGLHPSEGFLTGTSFVAGPFHQSFKELVLTEIWNDILKENCNHLSSNEITICVAPDQFNYAIGYSGKNSKMLNETFRKVQFNTDNSLKNREFTIC